MNEPTSSIGVSARKRMPIVPTGNMTVEQIMKDPAHKDAIHQRLVAAGVFKTGGKKRSCKKHGGKKRSCKKHGGKKRSCKKRS